MVFHCHGRLDQTEDCVITEEDYRDWYFRDSEKRRTYAQTLDIVTNSMPLLLVGYSMNDAELMRWMQLVHANRTDDPMLRKPIFLILREDPKKSPQQEWDTCRAIHERYGVHTILYGPEREQRQDLHEKLQEIKEGLENWWEGIQAKPKIKQFYPESNVGKDEYYHYLYQKVKDDNSYIQTAAYKSLKEKLDAAMASGPERFLTLIGGGGTGKTWAIQRFSQEWLGKSSENCPRKVFYWSSYYSNDLHTGIYRALTFFSADMGWNIAEIPVTNKERLEKFVSLLDELAKKLNLQSLIVFDGIERLLNPLHNTTLGESISPEVSNFFKTISTRRTGNGLFIVLTSRYLAKDLVDEQRPATRKLWIKAGPCLSSDLTGTGRPLANENDEFKSYLGRLCSLAQGNLYCLSLAETYLAKLPDSEKAPAIKKLVRKLGDTPVAHRNERMVQEAMQAAEIAFRGKLANPPKWKYPPPVQSFLERLALFMNPVEKEAVTECVRILTESGEDTEITQATKAILALLTKSMLVLEVQFNDGDGKRIGYTVHPLLQKYIRQHLHGSQFSLHPNMLLPGFTSPLEKVDPGNKRGRDVAINLFKELCDRADATDIAANPAQANALCRAAFGLLRARFAGNTVARWGKYDNYLRMIFKLYDSVRGACGVGNCWHQSEPGESATVFGKNKGLDAPLYLEEVAWLCNEIGFITFSMGQMLDAMSVWQQAHEFNRLIDGDSYGTYNFQTNFNMGVGYTYYGNLNQSRRYLELASEFAHELGDPQSQGRVRGYMALVDYLQGNLEEAAKGYDEALKTMERNARASSFFHCQLAELFIKTTDYKKAEESIQSSLSLAEGDNFSDLKSYARLVKARLLTSQGNYDKAQREFSVVLAEARRYGIRRLQTATLSGIATWALALNDSEIAIQKSMMALKVANEASLGLHQTLALSILGKATVLGGHRELGISYLKTARRLAKSQGYFLRATAIEEELQNNDANPYEEEDRDLTRNFA